MSDFEAFEKTVGEALDKAYRDAALFGTGVVAVPATPQPSAPAVACKAPEWCGQTWEQRKKNTTYRALKEANGGMACDLSDRGLAVFMFDKSELAFCSPACRDAKLPPLAARPVEAKPPMCSRCNRPWGGGHSCIVPLPAEQPKPAANGPTCSGTVPLHSGDVLARVLRHGERITLCDGCYLADEPAGGGSDVLHNDKHPERLPRPRLAHSMGHEDPTLPEAR